MAGSASGIVVAGSNAGGSGSLGGGIAITAGSGGSIPGSGGTAVGMGGDAPNGGGGIAQGGSAQGGTAQGGAAEGGTAQGGTAQGGTAQGGTAQGGTAQGGKGGTGGTGGVAGSASSAGTSSGGSSSGSGGTAPVDPYASARQTCVDRVNQLRATKGLGPIPRLSSAEDCVDGQAKSDSESGKAHGAFSACLNEVSGWTGAAQNECPGWGSVADTLGGCIDAMWGEGPGGGHYENMVGDYDFIACGFYTTPQGKVWMVQDFWRK